MSQFDLAKNGILMPDIVAFNTATKTALATMPQSGRHNYLAAKGWGAELAILGEAKNRKKNKLNFTIPYRSHSDFELYGVSDEFAYTEAFYNIFGA
jgi:hypothetical protein